MELTNDATYATPKVSCCVCGIVIDSNPSNMCGNCIRSHVDIAEGLVKEYIIVFCPECERYLQPPKFWLRAEFESRELMTLCLKRIRGLNKYTLVDASFLWTEPHSKRLKMRVTLQKEIFTNTVIQQTVQVDYEVVWQQCPTCQKAATGQPQWDAVVQLRQKVTHRRTFLFLEQLILRHNMQDNCTRIDSHPDGLDFFYGHKSHANSFVDFLNSLAPISRLDACQLVSHDSKSNVAVQHHTFSIEICPLCREDLILLPKAYRQRMGGLGPIVIVHKVFSSIVFLDPSTLRAGEITGTLYWTHPFQPLTNSRQMAEFYVVDLQPTGVVNGKLHQAIATVCLSHEVGHGREFIVQTHLGALLNVGDLCKGYFVSALNVNNEEFDKEENLPDVVLVRKHFPSQISRRGARRWKVKRLEIMEPQGLNARDREEREREAEEFVDEVERDSDLRRDINIYRDYAPRPAVREDAQDDQDDDHVPDVDLAEVLDEMQIGSAAPIGEKRFRPEADQGAADLE